MTGMPDSLTRTRRRWPFQSPRARARGVPGGSATVILLLLVAAAAAAPWISPYDPGTQLDISLLKNAAPTRAHPLGTDPFSRDVLSRVLHGARSSFAIGALGALGGIALAMLWGAAAGLAADRVAHAAVATADVLRSVPRKLLLLCAAMLLSDPTPLALALMLGLSSVPALSSVFFIETRSIRDREFVAAARAIGASPWRVLARHIGPHLLGTALAMSAMLVGDIMAVEAALSFLGLGMRPPRASLGAMVQDGLPYLGTAWWTAGASTAVLVTAVVCIARLADRLSDRTAR